MHNGQLANPRNPIVKKMKKLTSKRNKTDSDHDKLAELEFIGGLYMDENGPVLTSDVIDATVQYGARKFKEGKTHKMACYANSAKLEYDGPRTADKLWKNKEFVLETLVKIGQSRIVRTRPIFKDWSATIEIFYNEELVNQDRIIEWVNAAGEQVGFLDWRPKYGRFTVEVLK